MVVNKPNYELLLGLLRYGELTSEDIDQICKEIAERPLYEKQVYDLKFKAIRTSRKQGIRVA